MKDHLIIILFSFSVFIKAQDSSFCYNSGIINEQEITTETKTPEIFTRENSLILMPVMNENEVVMLMKEKNNSGINKLLKKFKLSKMFQNIGFTALPEALAGATFIGVANSTGLPDNIYRIQHNIGLSLLGLSAVCLTSSVCFKMVRTKNYKKAIKKYNETYN